MTTSSQLVDAETNRVLVENLEIADTFWSRLKGLQFRRELSTESGVLLIPCSSIHTFWMRFAIDVAFLDKSGLVLDVRSRVRPWRIVRAPHGTYAILEMNADTMQVQPQSRVRVERPNSHRRYFSEGAPLQPDEPGR